MRILFVAFQDSIHVAQWVKLLDKSGHDIHLFCPHIGPVHEKLRNITVHAPRLQHFPWEDRFLEFLERAGKRLESLGLRIFGSVLHRGAQS
jgi:hypothetical protein